MGTSKVLYTEVRFIFENAVTQVYVCLKDLTPMETPINVPGWHHKTYSSLLSAIDILNLIKNEEEHDPLMWDRGAPP